MPNNNEERQNMTGYLLNFSIYTLAMVGVIFAALFVFKGVMTGRGFSKKSEFLNIQEVMNLSPRKTLYVIKAGEERFLIASDVDKTSLISKLDPNGLKQPSREDKSSELDTLYGPDSLEEFASVIDFKKGRTTSRDKGPLMRELARKLEF